MQTKLRVSEVFSTVQGEGPKTGRPSVFVRFAGCNLQCPGWGVQTTLPSGKQVTGCDTPHAVFAELYKDDPKYTAEKLVKQIPSHIRNICITGGEPFLQPREELKLFTNLLLNAGYEVEFFTNGTFRLFNWENVSYVVDYKLSGTGETKYKIHPENLGILTRPENRIKFVIKNAEDFKEALVVMDELSDRVLDDFHFLMGPVWGLMDPQELVAWILDSERDNIDLNLQTHQLIGIDETERTMFGKSV